MSPGSFVSQARRYASTQRSSSFSRIRQSVATRRVTLDGERTARLPGRMTAMTSWVFDGVALPDGEAVRLELGAGEPQALPGRFALPGLVDSHCHLTVGRDEIGPRLFGREFAEARLDDLARAGVGVVRDVGGDRSITLKLAAHQEKGRPFVLAAGPDDTPAAQNRRRIRSEHVASLLPLATRYGVRILAGSDVVGTVAREVDLLVQHGLSVTEALAAAATAAHDYLGVSVPEDLVTYDEDPRERPEVLASPAAVVLRGQRIR
jgi:imidazolonepropionase-like amidohydrolase